MARTKQTGRRGAPPAKKSAKKKPASKAKKPSGAAAPAHPNELRISDEYDRCPDERFDLDTARTSFAHLKEKPPGFRRGHPFRNLRRSRDGWVPGERKPRHCKRSYKELAERWAAEHSKAELDQYKKDCVWGEWCPSMPPPNWWRLDLDDDATYRVLCFCWRYNFRCYQPVLSFDFDQFCKKALKRDDVARQLTNIDKSCKTVAEEAWNEKNKKPKKCDNSVYVGFFT